ncbi:hypothetical protein MKW98_025282 [Papaver atlanticum]|uniref:Uncharacterized protein n=1 Tax=Papaver atlanticum TaxID=357466 RepID=A0AAD4X7N0_9MAGN|nr:hypothetical protein MKW98_025282 [Papaver atlanticum]
MKQGFFLSFGPIKKVFLPPTKMGDTITSLIEKDVQVRFKVLGTEREVWILGSLGGDYLGPICTGES